MKNTYEVRGDTTAIQANGKSGERFEFLIDTADLPLVESLRGFWYARWMEQSGRYYIAGALNRGRYILLHRHILNAQPPSLVDHVNNDPFDNRRSNLRIATNQQNMRNQSVHRGSISPYKGVTFHREAGKWQAQIKTNGRNHYLGLFTDPVHAAQAYDRKAVELFGGFAKTNFPLEGRPA